MFVTAWVRQLMLFLCVIYKHAGMIIQQQIKPGPPNVAQRLILELPHVTLFWNPKNLVRVIELKIEGLRERTEYVPHL